METKTYPNKELLSVNLSTIVKCAKCKRENAINEGMLQDGDNYYHRQCVSDVDKEKSEETKIYTVKINDDLSVKSEGR